MKTEPFLIEDRFGEKQSIFWNDITKISILTTDKGPFEDDVFLCLYGSEDKEIMIPSESHWYSPIYDHVSKFNGFDFDRVIQAMSSTDNNEFICWEKDSS